MSSSSATRLSIADDLKADYLELRSARTLATHLPASLHETSMIGELSDDSDALWKGFISKHRTKIRRTYKNGLSVESGGEQLLDEFYSVLAESWRNLVTPIYGKRYF